MNFGIEDLPVAAACFAPIHSDSVTYCYGGLNAKANFLGDFVILESNGAFNKLFGFNAAGVNFSQISDGSGFFNYVAASAFSGYNEFVHEIDGEGVMVHLKNVDGGFIVCVDSNASKADERDDNRRLRFALQSLATGVITTSRSGTINYINPAALSLIGFEGDVSGKRLIDVLQIFGGESHKPIAIPENFGQSGVHISNAYIRDKNNKIRSIDISASAIQSSHGCIGTTVLLRDTTDEQDRAKEIRFLSYHDKLTGLYNRAYFEKKLKEYDRSEYLPVSVIIGDANGLKITNDIFGHRQGDTLLVSIANILSLACRDTDIIARYGGDEFTVLMPSTTLDEAARVFKNIMTLCNDQSQEQSRISISLGYATKETESQNMNDILNVAEDFMYRHKLLESKSYRSSVISSLKKMLYERSYETEAHAMRLTGLCAEMGKALNLSQNELNELELFSMLHDIGKIGIKDSILMKPDKLDDDEWTEMRKHCEVGYRIAQSAPELSHIAEYILCHHEKWDGSGYPQHLSGPQIPLLARILSVADSYDAMVNDRYYRKAVSREAAVGEIKRCSGTQFDPEVVEVFLKVV